MPPTPEAPLELEEATIVELQEQMAAGRLTALALVDAYLARIEALDRAGPTLRSVIEANPDAREIARALDGERASGHVRGPLHGIPILLKDNIDTADRMQTSAGSLALVGEPAPQDSTVAARLRKAGAVILGKSNVSEWANMRSMHSTSGWSGRGGLTRNPYALDRNASGSSSGSAVAVAANLTAASLGTETDGSIVSPAGANGVVGIKPTVGLTSRAGVVPISHSQDTVGPHARTVADAATVLSALVGLDPRDPATKAAEGHLHADYTAFLDADGLRGARIGVARKKLTGYSERTDELFEEGLRAMRDAGATLVDPADLPGADASHGDGDPELTVLLHEFKRDLAAYLGGRPGVPVRSLGDVIAFNEAHAEQELPWFGHDVLTRSEADEYTEAQYEDALRTSRRLGGADGIDAALRDHRLDAIVAPTGPPAWLSDLINGDPHTGGSSSAAAMAGYPLISVPCGHVFGLPVGITFMGTAWSEPTLIRLASGFEAVTRARRKPGFAPTAGNETAL